MSEPRTVVQLFDWRVSRSLNLPALRFRVASGLRDLTWQEWQARARRIARGLLSLGFDEGDRAALIGVTSVQFAAAEMGVMLAAGVSVPLYEASAPKHWARAIAAARCRVVFVDSEDQLRLLSEMRARIPSVERVVLLRPEQPDRRADNGDPADAQPPDVPSPHFVLPHLALTDLVDRWDDAIADEQLRREHLPKPATPASIVYTPGTTGPPKGVVLTHGNLTSQAYALAHALEMSDGDVQHLFLPLAWVLTKVLLLAAMRAGCVTALSPDADQALADAKEIRPTFIGVTSAFCERLYRTFVNDVRERSGAGKAVLAWARSLGSEVSKIRQAGKAPARLLSLQHNVAVKLAFSGLRSSFGGRLRFMVSGGAALSPSVGELFHAADLLVLTGFVLTEATGPTHINRPSAFRFGSAGPALPGVEARVSDEGEVLVRGPNVMAGYFEAPAETKAVMDGDGWLRTGDIGEIDADGVLRVTERRQHMIVLADGRTVAPQGIEALLKQSPYVRQALVAGDDRPYLSALLTLDEDAMRRWAERRGLALSQKELCSHPEVFTLVKGVVDEKNTELADFEVIKKFAILDTDLTCEGGDLTPTEELRRELTLEKYRWILDSFYSEGY